MRFNVTNRTTGVRSFNAGGRYLTLAGGEVERGVELRKDEADALNVTGEFYVTALEDPLAEKSVAERMSKPAAPAGETKTTNQKP